MSRKQQILNRIAYTQVDRARRLHVSRYVDHYSARKLTERGAQRVLTMLYKSGAIYGDTPPLFTRNDSFLDCR